MRLSITLVVVTTCVDLLWSGPLRASVSYPAPPPWQPDAEQREHLRRSLTLLGTSTPMDRKTVRVLFYGQSITQQAWWKEIERYLRATYANANLIIENHAIGGHASQLLVKTAEADLYPFQPDLLIFHVYGSHIEYENLIRRVRECTCADILLQTDHITSDASLTEETDPAKLSPAQWDPWMNHVFLSATAARYGACRADIHERWKAYLKAHSLKAADLLRDGVHLNPHGEWLMAELLKAYLAPLAPKAGYDPFNEPRVNTVLMPPSAGQDSVRLEFTGTRADLVFKPSARGGFSVRVDGQPPSAIPELYGFTRVSAFPMSDWPVLLRVGSQAPRVAEEWSLKIDQASADGKVCHFSLRGSVTGEDGEGSSTSRFVSRSGRVVIEPNDWNLAYCVAVFKRPLPENHTATWRAVLRGTDTAAPPAAAPGTEACVTLAQGLAPGRHVLELRGAEGAEQIQAARFYRPQGESDKTTDTSHVLRPVDHAVDANLFLWSDTCNVYVIRDQDAAILIDLGDGSVLDHLAEIGVSRVEWVLFTHHHREQCQGAQRLAGTGAKLAAPEAERALFERPADFRRMEVSLGDAFTIHGASYVRPPIQSIPLDRTFKTHDTFTWRGREFLCLDTPGNSPGAISYILKQADGSLAFSGDVMLDGGLMHTWFDTEWDYGFSAGIRVLRQSVMKLAALGLAGLLPSHGPRVLQPTRQLDVYGRKLERLEQLYLRGYDAEGGSAAYQDKVSTPTVVPDVVQVSPHLFKFKRPNFWPNFGLILADSGRALVVDCGLLDEAFLDTALDGMRERFGLKAIDAVLITHVHGDHFLEAPHLREKWGTKIWALNNMVDKMEHPEWFAYAAPIQAYGKKAADGSQIKGVHVDRVFKPGECFDWQGYHFRVDWMPGQTEFALCLHGRIDGRHVAFTGDNLFGDPDNPAQTGHEAMVAHNSAILEEGYIYGSEYLRRIRPDLLVGGHSFVMDHPAAFIERCRQWSYEMRDAFRSLSSEPDYRSWFDPFWVRAEPYRVVLRPGQTRTVDLHLRNFRSQRQTHRIEIHTPPDLAVEPAVLEGRLSPESRRAFAIRVKASRDAEPGVQLIALDVTVDGRRYGEWFDFVVGVVPNTSMQQGPPSDLMGPGSSSRSARRSGWGGVDVACEEGGSATVPCVTRSAEREDSAWRSW